MKPLTLDSDRATFDVPAFAKIVGVSRNTAYLAVKRGEIASFRIGNRIVIPRTELHRLMNGSSHKEEHPA